MSSQRRLSWMWAEACALIDEAERRHRSFFGLLTATASAPVWEPPVNIYSAGDDLLISVALPGARSEDLDIRITSTGLLVEANVPPPHFAAGVNVSRLEIPYGRMRRRIDLPPGSYVMREHRLENGCLSLRLTGSCS